MNPTLKKIFFRIWQIMASLAVFAAIVPTAAAMAYVGSLFVVDTPLYSIDFLTGLFATVFAGGGILLLVGGALLIHNITSQRINVLGTIQR
jgi:hypothetical protein